MIENRPARFALRANSSLILGGGGGMMSFPILSKIESWPILMKNYDHSSPHFNDGKMVRFALRVNSSLILEGARWGGGGWVRG